MLSLLSMTIYCQTPQLLLDLNLDPASGAPEGINTIIEFKENLVFMADDGLNGQEYWSYNPSAGTTNIILDLFVGQGDGVNSSIVKKDKLHVFNNRLYLSGRTEKSGVEPFWSKDGTSLRLLKDIESGFSGSEPSFKMTFAGALYFTAVQNGDRELYKVDEDNIVSLVKNLNTSYSSSPLGFAVNAKEMAFSATIGDDEGCGLYTISANGTLPVLRATVNTICECQRNEAVYLGDTLLVFTAKDSLLGRELWGLPAQSSTPFLISDIDPSGDSNPEEFYVFNDVLYFSADGPDGRELYRTDGTKEGTYQVKNISFSSISSSPKDFIEYNNELFFLASGALYKTDGTEVGTVEIADVIGANELSGGNNLMYIGANELWASDGTAAGTLQLVEIYPGAEHGEPRNLYVKDDIVYFFATDELHNREFFKNEGIAISELIKDINTGTEDYTGEFTPFDNHLYLSKNESDTMLWRSDGTTGDIEPFYNLEKENFMPLAIKNGLLFFTTDNETGAFQGKILWKTDGTEVGTVPLTHADSVLQISSNPVIEHYKDFLISGIFNSIPVLFRYDIQTESLVQELRDEKLRGKYAFIGDDLYYSYEDNVVGTELYKNENLFRDINLTGSSFPGSSVFTTIDNKLFFNASAEVSGNELYVTDGTTSGTMLIQDISPNINESSFFQKFSRYKNNIALEVSNGSRGYWLSDGTDVGTYKIGEYGQATADVPFAELNGDLFFRGHDDINGTELWKSNGTVGGSSLLKKLNNTSERGFPRSFYQFNNIMYFFGNDDSGFFNGLRYLWRSDGTASGTFKVSDSVPVGFRPMHVLNDKLFFRASNGLSGYEIFYIQSCAASITPTCVNGPCEVRSEYESSDKITFNGNQKVYPLEKARLNSTMGTEISGEFEVDKYGLLEVYTDGCSN